MPLASAFRSSFSSVSVSPTNRAVGTDSRSTPRSQQMS